MVDTGRAMWPRQVERRTTRACWQAKRWVWVRHMVGRGVFYCAVASVVVDWACPWQPIEVGKKNYFLVSSWFCGLLVAKEKFRIFIVVARGCGGL